MSTGITCDVYLDGQRMADGRPGDNPLDPTALSGLQVQWGRSTTVDQPEPNTCTFNVLDDPGGTSFLNTLRTGLRVDVFASGTFYADPTVPMFADPSFEALPVGATPAAKTSRARTAITGRHAHSGGGPTVWTETRRNYAIGTAGRVGTTTGAITKSYPDPRSVRATMTTVGNTAWSDAISYYTTNTTNSSSGFLPCKEGDVVRVSSVYRSNDSRKIRIRYSFYDEAGVSITGSVIRTMSDDLQPVVGEWSAPIEFELLAAPPGSVKVNLYVQSITGVPSSVPAGFELNDWIDFGNHLFTINDPDVTFFDGDTVSADPLKRYSWAGTPGASASIEETATPDPGQSARVTPTDYARTGTAAFAPAAFAENPDAWDALTPTNPGVIWQVGASVLAYPGTRITVAPVRWARPDGTEYTIDPGQTITATGVWQTVLFDYSPQVFGQFVGVAVSFAGAPPWSAVPGTWSDQPAGWAWIDYGSVYVDDVVVTGPGSGTLTTVEVFSGRITDLEAGFDTAADAPVVAVTAQDFTADLENVDVGDAPFPVEALSARFARIIDLSGFDAESVIDPALAPVRMSWDDVDAQPVMSLLRDLAQSVDGVLWSASHATVGPYLWMEDTSERAAMFTLELENGVVVIVPGTATDAALEVSACDVLRDPVKWRQDVADVSTRVAVTWLEQTLDDDGNPDPTERTVTVIDAGLEAAHGQRRIAVSTLLQSQADAIDVAGHILGRTNITDWRADGITIDDDDSLTLVDVETVRMLLALLDGTRRIGMPIRLVDLPAWSPSGPVLPVYLEGGAYTYTDGAWTLELTISHATGQGQSAAWVDMDPTWTWAMFDPAITWQDMAGVRYPDNGKETP
jgi:hypothetical protein